MRVAFQGVPGCFSHAAAVAALGPDIGLEPCADFDTLFSAVIDANADLAVVPVENSLAGAVVENLDLLVRHPVTVISETYVRVELCLVTRPGVELDAVRVAASHPVALRQCRDFFRAHPHIQPVAAFDTAGSIRDLMAGGPQDAAIGPALAAELYGGAVLLRGIEDHRRNFTRFFLVSTQGSDAPAEPPRRPKCSLAFTLADRPGALHTALGIFATRGVDLTRLESRPIPGHPWEYRFYADIRGDLDGQLKPALEALRDVADQCRVFGVYEEVAPPGMAG